MNSWKTTSAGIALIISSIVGFIFALRTPPLTQEVVMGCVTGLLGGIGLLFAKDANVTGGTKTFKMIAVFCILSVSVSSQSLFKPMKKPVTFTKNLKGAIATATNSTTVNVFRPVVNIASYLVDFRSKDKLETSLLSGGGVGYQHNEFNESTQRWNTVWSINALAWGKIPLSGGSPGVLYGITGGILNDNVMAGVATDGKIFFLTLGVGINFNN